MIGQLGHKIAFVIVFNLYSVEPLLNGHLVIPSLTVFPFRLPSTEKFYPFNINSFSKPIIKVMNCVTGKYHRLLIHEQGIIFHFLFLFA